LNVLATSWRRCEKKALLEPLQRIAANYTDETAAENGGSARQIDAQNLWDLDSQVEMAMEALRCPLDRPT